MQIKKIFENLILIYPNHLQKIFLKHENKYLLSFLDILHQDYLSINKLIQIN